MLEIIQEQITSMLNENISDFSSIPFGTAALIVLVLLLIVIGLYILLFLGLLKLNRRIFKKIERKKGHSISLQFLQKTITLALIVFFIVIPMGGKKVTQSLLGSTAVVAAVVGLAANEVLKNMFAGLEISLYKPFDVGSRIMLEDGTTGIVDSLNLRHVVLKLVDTTRMIIPNSKVSAASIINYSFVEYVPRSFELRYPVSYDSDIDKAKEIIRKTICDNPLTLNEDKYNEDDPGSRSVYFLELKDSSIILGATVYYPHEIRTEVVKDEINTCVFKALAENNIEIPYNYVNVVVDNKS